MGCLSPLEDDALTNYLTVVNGGFKRNREQDNGNINVDSDDLEGLHYYRCESIVEM